MITPVLLLLAAGGALIGFLLAVLGAGGSIGGSFVKARLMS
ncbi:hypothetical protein [Cyanobium sp. Morenito 9A2]|nr:hypothetical protein [Cyanobium sp. Morenito 9A2]